MPDLHERSAAVSAGGAMTTAGGPPPKVRVSGGEFVCIVGPSGSGWPRRMKRANR